MNTHHKRILIAMALLLAAAGVLVFDVLYQAAKTTAIARLNEEQVIHARQAARGIEDFFATWMRNLSALAGTDEIRDNTAVGQQFMDHFYEANRQQVLSVTRTDERGVITYNFPQTNSVGKDLSQQKHMQEMLLNHQPVISDVVESVEGPRAVALHVPVFQGAEFKGTVGTLINFQTLAHRYLDVIKIGQTGYAWVISRDGTILYTPVRSFTGKSVFELITNSPALKVVVGQMLQGHVGEAQYNFDRIGDQMVEPTRKYAVYLPVHIANTLWSTGRLEACPTVPTCQY